MEQGWKSGPRIFRQMDLIALPKGRPRSGWNKAQSPDKKEAAESLARVERQGSEAALKGDKRQAEPGRQPQLSPPLFGTERHVPVTPVLQPGFVRLGA